LAHNVHIVWVSHFYRKRLSSLTQPKILLHTYTSCTRLTTSTAYASNHNDARRPPNACRRRIRLCLSRRDQQDCSLLLHPRHHHDERSSKACHSWSTYSCLYYSLGVLRHLCRRGTNLFRFRVVPFVATFCGCQLISVIVLLGNLSSFHRVSKARLERTKPQRSSYRTSVFFWNWQTSGAGEGRRQRRWDIGFSLRFTNPIESTYVCRA
jgi:hypothetical protein